jgi:hypothetical protein
VPVTVQKSSRCAVHVSIGTSSVGGGEATGTWHPHVAGPQTGMHPVQHAQFPLRSILGTAGRWRGHSILDKATQRREHMAILGMVVNLVTFDSEDAGTDDEIYIGMWGNGGGRGACHEGFE